MSIGPYRIIEALGSGANGEVYLAEDLRLGRKVAIKTLSAIGGKEPSDARRWMLREARAAARLNHPHIAGVYDVVESPQGAHIVMEYVRGETLAFRVREGPLPPGQVLEIAIQLTDALAEAHAMGVVHRDLKPANVMITPKGDVKILDFGLAQVRPVEPGSTPMRSSRDFTLDGRQVGTPPYMPPEHLMGDPVDARGDLYSLGVMLYELLTGRRPFRGPDAMKLTMAILTEPTPKASESNPAVPEALDAVVFRAMSRLPQERYASASELAADLRGAAAGVAPAALAREIRSDAPTASRGRGWPMRVGRKRRALSLGGLAMVVALAMYGAVSNGRLPIATQPLGPPVVAVLPLAGVSGDPQDESLATGIADTLISSLSRVPGLNVISRQATLRYRERNKDTGIIARELGANVVVDGAIQRSGDKVRVSLSLLRPESKVVVWTNTYDGSFADVFSLQSEVAGAVVDAFRLTLSPADRERLERPPTDNVDALADYSQGRMFLDRPDVKGNRDRAILLLQKAAEKDPRFARPYAALSEAYLEKYAETGDLAWAIKSRDAMTDASRLDPHDPTVGYARAMIYKAAGRRGEAIEELRRLIAARPGSNEAHELLGQLLADIGKPEEALTEIRKAIHLRPGFWNHYQALGMVYYNSGRYAEAAAAFQRVTELQPDNGWGFQMLGTTFNAMGDRNRARTNYERAVALGHARAYSNLGTLYYGEGRYADAARAYTEAIRLEPNSALKHRNLGDVFRKLGEHAKARAAYEKAAELSIEQLKVNPRDALTMARLGVYEAKLGKYFDAVRHVEQAATINPQSGEVLYRKAVVYALAKQPEKSLAALDEALRNGYSPAFAREDDDLAIVKSTARYRALLGDI
jgi:tetratricopeptide (TPR) repeat protein